MNILFVHDSELEEKDGVYYSAGGLSEDIFNRYLEKGDKIYLFTRQKKTKNDVSKMSKVSSDNIICVPSKIYKSPIDYFFNKKKIKKELYQILDKMDFCIIRLPSFLGNVCYDAIKSTDKKYMVEMVACPWDSLWNYGNIKSKIFAPIFYFMTKNRVKKSKKVIYVTEKFLQCRYPTNGESISISNVNIKVADDEVLINRLKKIDNMKKNSFKIGMIGYLDSKIKGHITAFESISVILKKIPNINVELHILGKGNKTNLEMKAEELGIREHIYFDGTLPGGEPVLQWMDELDLFLLPSLQEGLPRCLIEAISRGCPAVTTNAGGSPELLEKEFVCNKKDYMAIAEKIMKFINDKNLMKEQAKRNFNYAKKYDKFILNKKRKDFMKKILDTK